MTDSDESISLTDDGSMLNPWFQAVDAGIHTLGQLLDFSGDMAKRVTREQHDTVNAYLDTMAGRLSSTSPKTDVPKQAATGTALVTGGTGGLGTEICRRFAAEGYHIISTYIAAEKNVAREWRRERAREGMTVCLYECDVTDYESCRALAWTLEERYGPPDILVNCAGITRDAMLRKMHEGDWHAVLDTNLESVFNVTRPFIDGMIRNGYGRIINISSVNGQKGQFGQSNYSAAKAGMIGFTRSLALELAQTGITVNCVCPGYVATSMVEAIREDILQGIVAQIPLGRLAKPEEIADAVAFLAKRDSAYITGTDLAVNGGLWLG
jgi:acetoacetyl-CoA reductase